MAVTVTAWTASHTGLPSFRIVTDIAVTVAAGQRKVAALEPGDHLLSDAFADPGATTLYTIGAGSFLVARMSGVPVEAVFTDVRGRGVAGLLYQANADPIDFRPNVVQFNRTVTRWPAEVPPVSGRGVLIMTDPSREPDVWRVCQARSKAILSPSHTSPDDPLRTIVVTGVRRSRLKKAGWLEFEVSWTETDAPATVAPVVTWGEWAGLGTGWRSKSLVQVARDLAGMP